MSGDKADEPRDVIPAPRPLQAIGTTARFAVAIAIAALLVATEWPSSPLPRLVVWLAMIGLIGITSLEVAVRAGFSRDPELSVLPSRLLISGWIEKNETTSADMRLTLARQLFYDGRDSRARISRYAILMLLASLIATAGVIADSTAVVIGAMLIAPLITPMMGMALGLVMGWQSKLVKATLLVLTGMTIAVGVGWLLPFLLTTAVDPDVNTQIVSRSSPTLLDLVVAIAAGAAGSYALARPDVSSSLPGVAIAIALVPPLAVFGLLLNLNEWSLAAGAGLLFATNLVGILITGGLVFIVAGTAPLRRFSDAQDRVRVAIGAVVLGGLVTVGALAANGATIARDSLDTDLARATTLSWLENAESELSIVTIEVEEGVTMVLLAGAGDPPSPELLAEQLAEALSRPVTLDLQWIPRNQTIVSAEDT